MFDESDAACWRDFCDERTPLPVKSSNSEPWWKHKENSSAVSDDWFSWKPNYSPYTSYVPYSPPPKWQSAGCVVLPGLEEEDLGLVYVIRPSGQWVWTLPKGRLDEGESPEAAALRETREETGLDVILLPEGDLGTGEGSFSVTQYYMAVARPDTSIISPQKGEVDVVDLVTFDEARIRFAGNKRDLMVLERAATWLAALQTIHPEDLLEDRDSIE